MQVFIKKSWSSLTSLFFTKKLEKIPKKVLENALKIGTSMHYILQSFFQNKKIELLEKEKELFKNMNAMLQNLKYKSANLKAIEFCLETNNYFGFIDCIFKNKNNIELLEFKSKGKQNINKLDIYNVLQIMFYKWLYCKIYKPKQPKNIKISILQACKVNETYKYIFLEKDGLKMHFDDYLRIWNYLKWAGHKFIKLAQKIKSENDYDNFYEINKFLTNLKPYFVFKRR